MLQPVLDRMRALKALHVDGATFSQRLRALEQEQSDAAAELREERELLAALRESMVESVSQVQRNCDAMDERMQAMARRMESL